MSEQVMEPSAGLKDLFKSKPSPAPTAEEPTGEEQETPTENKQVDEVKEEVAEVETEKEKLPETEKEVEEVKAEEEKPEVTEDGFTVINFDDEGEKEAPNNEEFEKTVQELREQNKLLLEEKQKLETREDLDPRVKKLNEWLKSGGDFDRNFWELQNKDYTKVNFDDTQQGIEVLSDKLRYVDGLDEEEIKYHLEKNYPILTGVEEALEDREERDERMKLRMEVKPSVPKLEEIKNKAQIPNVDHNRQEEYEKQVNLYRAEASAKFDEIKHLDIEIDADNKLRLPITGEAEKFARSIIVEPENQAQFFLSRYSNEDGSTNWGRFKTEMYYLENRPRIEKAIFSQGKSSGKKEILDEMDAEPSTKGTPNPPLESKAKSGLASVKFTKG